MKHNKNHDNAKNAEPELVSVRFEFTHPTARTVCIAGSFNHWQPEAKPMHSTGNGHWLKESALPPGDYEYCLVVDGQWMPDPQARETVPNPFGGRNSVLRVASPPEASRLASAASVQPATTNKRQEQNPVNKPRQAASRGFTVRAGPPAGGRQVRALRP